MKLLPSQLQAASGITNKLNKYGMCLLAGEVRSGKTLSFLHVAKKYKRVLIITTKKAMVDITKILPSNCDIINYHSAHKVDGQYDLVILDECHNYITGYPKRSQIWRNVYKHTSKNVHIIFSTGTPTPEGYAGLFNMFALSYNSPWKHYTRFTLWHEDYGLPYQMKIAGFNVTKYERTKVKKIRKVIKKYTVTITQVEAGHKFFAKDKIHLINMTRKQEKIIRKLDRDLIYEKGKYCILGDTPAKLMQKKHQISGGFCKCEEDVLMTFKDNPKVKYILEHFDTSKTIILANFVAEQKMLAEIFPHTGSVKKEAEGVDFSHFENMVIFSFGYSAKDYEQVRARQMNMFKRKTNINVNFLMTEIDQRIYRAVSKKKNFTRKWYG